MLVETVTKLEVKHLSQRREVENRKKRMSQGKTTGEIGSKATAAKVK